MPYIGFNPDSQVTQTAAFRSQSFTATAGQTTFTITGGYTPGYIDVFLNGIKQVTGTDVTATNGTTIVFTNALSVGYTVEVHGYRSIATNASTLPVANISFADGTTLSSAYGSVAVLTFTGDGTTTTFSTSPYTSSSVNYLLVHISGVYQRKSTYTWSGTSVVFSSAPPNATAIEICINYQTNTIGTPSAGTVTPTALSTGGPYWDTNGNIGIGTTSPAWNLTVRKDQNSATVFQILNANTGGTSQSIIQLQSGATQYVNYTVSYSGLYNQISSSGITSNYIDFDTQYFRNNSGVNRMIIDSAGALNVVTGPIKVGGNQAVNGPAFSAYNGSNQSISNNTYTKLQFPSEEYDTNNNFDNATNYRFTPTVAGYYQISGCFQVATQAEKFVMIYKNGVINKAGNDLIGWLASVSAIVYFNGSTDYVELYGYTGSGASTTSQAGAAFVWFQGVMVRGA
jgi:hypothetical protein